MEWIDGMNMAMDFIEEHLEEDISADELSRIAMCSAFHFQRMFAYITGVTLNEYIRRRRMSSAVFDLMNDEKVINVAMKYGYDSPTAFTRAFKQTLGIAPSEVRKQNVILNTFPKITFTFSVKGEQAMNYKIIKKEAFRVAGFKNSMPMTMENCFEKMPEVWKEFYDQDGEERLKAIMQDKEPGGILALTLCDNGEYGGCMIGTATDAEIPEGMTETIVPATTYAVFECIGALPDAMQSIQERIISEWLPASGYEYAPAPDIEVYPEGDRHSADYRSEVWLPVIKKNS
ncbi:MAG: effector binding domain-containing protein [Porcipelethomonas sp.]